MTKVHEFFDASDKRNVYAIGDVHGCFDKLRTELAKVNFDGDKDLLVSVGDLVDRGPNSEQALEWTKYPWLKRVVGNHEQMTMDHINGDPMMHVHNGGGWMYDMSLEEKREHAYGLNDAPYMLTVKTPKGQMVGFVHADLVWKDWQANIEAPDFKTFCWSRTGLQMLRDPDFDPTVTGIDKVFFGHNALHKPYSRGNCNWIDTGCGFEGGYLTLVNVETHGSILTV